MIEQFEKRTLNVVDRALQIIVVALVLYIVVRIALTAVGDMRQSAIDVRVNTCMASERFSAEDCQYIVDVLIPEMGR